MPAIDILYPVVKNALIKDGWTITHDPYSFKYGGVQLFADLGAERLMAAERNTERIVVEIKSFAGISPIDDFEKALGQFLLYLSILKRASPDRKLYLAIDTEINDKLFSRDGIRVALEDYGVSRIVVRVTTEEISSWIS